MIGGLGTTQVYLATAPPGLCKAFDGLAALVRHIVGQVPLSASLMVVCHRRKDRFKILVWESSGSWMLINRLEVGTFRWLQTSTPSDSHCREELTLLLGGIDLAGARRRKWYQCSLPAET